MQQLCNSSLARRRAAGRTSAAPIECEALRFRRANEPRASKGPANKVEAWLKSWTTERAGVTTNARLSSATKDLHCHALYSRNGLRAADERIHARLNRRAS